MARALTFARALLSSPLWVICWTVDVVSFFVQAAALHLGTLSLVEPMMVSTLLFTLPLAAVESRRWPSVRDWAGTVAVSVGLALVLLTRPVTEATTRPTALLLPALGLFLGVAVALLAAATGRGIAVKAMAASVAAGILFGKIGRAHV